MALSPSHRQYQAQKMKGILKQALKRRPISIQSLKKSLYINQSNLDGFVKYVKDVSDVFPTSINECAQKTEHGQQTEISGLRNIVKNMNWKAPTKEIFLRRNSIKGKVMKRQLKLQRSELKMDAQVQNQQNSLSNSFYKGKSNWCLENFKQKKIALDVRSSKMGNHSILRKGKNNMRNTFSVNIFKLENQNQTPNSFKFCRKSDKISTHRRWKTQEDVKSGDKSLGQLTQYCQKKNLKGINYLVLQLQLNIEGSKKMRKSTGPFY